MEFDTEVLMHSLIVLCAVSLVFAYAFVFFLASKLRHLQSEFRIYKKHQETQNRAITSGAMGLGKKLLALEKQFNNLHSMQEELQGSDLEFSFNQAQKMLEQGVETQAIAETSGLSASEVQLMELVHKQKFKDEKLELV